MNGNCGMLVSQMVEALLPDHGIQGKTGAAALVARLPSYEGILGQLLAGPPAADVCQSAMDFFQVLRLSRDCDCDQLSDPDGCAHATSAADVKTNKNQNRPGLWCWDSNGPHHSKCFRSQRPTSSPQRRHLGLPSTCPRLRSQCLAVPYMHKAHTTCVHEQIMLRWWKSSRSWR